jgi:hypothetical protein
MGLFGSSRPHPQEPVWTHPLLRNLQATPVRRKLGGDLARLARHGWTDADMNDYLAQVEQVTGAYHAIVAADFCVEQMPGIAPDEVARWVLLLHDPAYAPGAETPTEALYAWMDDDPPVSIPGYARAAAGDHELAMLALKAGITAAELARRVESNTVDREALRVLAALR